MYLRHATRNTAVYLLKTKPVTKWYIENHLIFHPMIQSYLLIGTENLAEVYC